MSALRPTGTRARVLDVLRLFAIFQMVQGHTIDAVLSPVYRSGLAHELWQSARGLTSVAFLFLAGAGFAFATRTERGQSPEARARRGRRALLLIAIGYAMRAPLLALILGDDTEQRIALEQALIVDVLQCIGVTLLALDAIGRWVPDTARRSLVLGALGGALLLIGPLTSRLDPSGALRPLLMYATGHGGSLFPLVPWAGHMLLGAALGPLFFDDPTAPAVAQRKRRALRLGGLGAALIALGVGLSVAVHPMLGQLARLGVVLWLAALLTPFESALSRCPAWLMALAQHSLLMYVLHVVLAYGQGIGLSSLAGKTLAPWPSVLAAAAMLAVSSGAALAYDAVQRRGSLAARTAPG